MTTLSIAVEDKTDTVKVGTPIPTLHVTDAVIVDIVRAVSEAMENQNTAYYTTRIQNSNNF
jgi:hypothetical protein